jgi:hypothetical protein
MVEVGTLVANITNYTTQGVGVNRTFTGVAEIHWGDDSFTRSSTSVESAHSYTSNGNFTIKLGAESDTSTSKLIFDTSRITSATGLKTGQVNNFSANDNLFTSLDLSNVPVITYVNINDNPNFTTLTFATTGNGEVSTCLLDDCDFSSLDFSNVPLSGSVVGRNSSSLSSVDLSNASNGVLSNFDFRLCSLSSVDFSSFSGFATGISIRLDSNGMTATEVDNQLIHLDTVITGTGYTGSIIIDGTNAARTTASDAAVSSLTTKGIVVTAN